MPDNKNLINASAKEEDYKDSKEISTDVKNESRKDDISDKNQEKDENKDLHKQEESSDNEDDEVEDNFESKVVNKVTQMRYRRGMKQYLLEWKGNREASWHFLTESFDGFFQQVQVYEEERKKKNEKGIGQTSETLPGVKAVKGKRKGHSWYYLSSSEDEETMLKDNFWKNLDEGKIDFLGNTPDLYSGIKEAGRVVKSSNAEDDEDPVRVTRSRVKKVDENVEKEKRGKGRTKKTKKKMDGSRSGNRKKKNEVKNDDFDEEEDDDDDEEISGSEDDVTSMLVSDGSGVVGVGDEVVSGMVDEGEVEDGVNVKVINIINIDDDGGEKGEEDDEMVEKKKSVRKKVVEMTGDVLKHVEEVIDHVVGESARWYEEHFEDEEEEGDEKIKGKGVKKEMEGNVVGKGRGMKRKSEDGWASFLKNKMVKLSLGKKFKFNTEKEEEEEERGGGDEKEDRDDREKEKNEDEKKESYDKDACDGVDDVQEMNGVMAGSENELMEVEKKEILSIIESSAINSSEEVKNSLDVNESESIKGDGMDEDRKRELVKKVSLAIMKGKGISGGSSDGVNSGCGSSSSSGGGSGSSMNVPTSTVVTVKNDESKTDKTDADVVIDDGEGNEESSHKKSYIDLEQSPTSNDIKESDNTKSSFTKKIAPRIADVKFFDIPKKQDRPENGLTNDQIKSKQKGPFELPVVPLERFMVVKEIEGVDGGREIKEYSIESLEDGVKRNEVDVVRRMIEKLGRFDPDNKRTNELIWTAVKNGYNTVVSILACNNANIEATNREGRTPLIYAAEKGMHTTAYVLCLLGADWNAKSGGGDTAMVKAMKGGHRNVVMMMLGAGYNLGSTIGGLPLTQFAKQVNSCDVIDVFNLVKMRMNTELVQRASQSLECSVKIEQSVFPIQCLKLKTDEHVYNINFHHDLLPTKKSKGMLLFVGHGEVTPDEVLCELRGSSVVARATLNNNPLTSLSPDPNFIFTFSPLMHGNNIICLNTHPLTVATCNIKLIVCAYLISLAS